MDNKVMFTDENTRFELVVENEDGFSVVTPQSVQSIRVLLKQERTGKVWLDFRYPQVTDFPEITLEDGKFFMDITTEQAATATEGNVFIYINYRTNDPFAKEGFKSLTRKGTMFFIKPI